MLDMNAHEMLYQSVASVRTIMIQATAPSDQASKQFLKVQIRMLSKSALSIFVFILWVIHTLENCSITGHTYWIYSRHTYLYIYSWLAP